MNARKMLVLLLALALCFGVFGVAGCSSDDADTDEEATVDETTDEATDDAVDEYTLIQDGKIIVGSDTAYPPFEYIDDSSEVLGFDVDIATAIGEELGLDVEFKTYNFDALIVGVQGGTEFDMIASAMTITAEREESIDFSDAYIDSNQSLAVAEDSEYTTLADLVGEKIGVQSGTTGEAYANDNLPEGATVVPFENILQAMQSLQSGEIAGVVNDLPISADIVKDEARGLKLVEEITTNEQYGFAFSDQNTGLRDAVNVALATIKSNGTYDEIYKKWFGETP
ncbi:MAG: basic amino acid ABC transporter substrate-binding protein [Actinomycetota bacterium]|jgi:polar amino acid transport system substrate-binding protein|nr:basic amino acid ABC transporter substrate-binding protein [Actinomycetota bacterium]